jgi:murein DD-endopeptidase MepM/ murein hydrolase activator NlpD
MMKKDWNFINIFFRDVGDFLVFFLYYSRRKVVRFSVRFEKGKNYLVKFFMMKRGRYNRPFLHLATMGVLAVGILIAPFLADTYPIFAAKSPAFAQQPDTQSASTIEVGQDVFGTELSQKPRDKVITYSVEKGDTIETIAKKFDISTDTIKWANDINSSDFLSIGQELKILPVTGIAHKVAPGETIYSIAQKYSTSAQGIVDFPFNTFADPETFAMVAGQMIIVPGGVEPSQQSTYVKTPEVYIATGTVPVGSNGWYFPVGGSISQYASWYHMALDIAGSVGTPVYAAHSGTVERVSLGGWDSGYGNNVWINDGDGVQTHYAHLNAANASVGQNVVGGQTIIGYRGNTGRSTGPHTHFEIRVNGSLVNPLLYVHP